MTNPVLDQWTALDPQLFKARMVIALGSDPFTTFDVLDETRFQADIDTAVSGTFFFNTTRGPLGPGIYDTTTAPKDMASGIG